MNEMVERVSKALRTAPKVFYRDNWQVDLRHEVCRYGVGSEPEIVVMGACLQYSDVESIENECRFYLMARAAIEAMRMPTEGMTTAIHSTHRPGWDVSWRTVWTTMIDVALKDE